MCLVLLALASCQEPPIPQGNAPALSDACSASAEAVERGGWLDAHPPRRIAARGAASEGSPEQEIALDSTRCGSCHPQQYADWKDSWHALTMGAGVLGQLVDEDGTHDEKVDRCQSCHAPLTEQYPRIADSESGEYRDNPDYQAELRDDGLVCVACHVPARSASGLPADATGEPVVHPGGFEASDEYEHAELCSTCHDFTPQQLALNGKLLQETTQEWRCTKYAEQGVRCQDCHMPDGRHLFRGVHDADMVKSGFTASGSITDPGGLLQAVQATLTVSNTGTGHRMPTYSTPQITLVIEQLDEDGQPIEGTRREGAIGRFITPNLSSEVFDTRLLPDESYTLPYAVRRATGATTLSARVEVWPDEGYRRFYTIKLKEPDAYPRGLAELQKALQNTIDSRYTAWERTWTLD